MNRFTTQIFGLAASIALSVSASADVVSVPQSVMPEKIEGAKPRNVVFILSDDHRYDAMSFMGHPFAKTPHMDAMAQQWCAPQERIRHHFALLPEPRVDPDRAVHVSPPGDRQPASGSRRHTLFSAVSAEGGIHHGFHRQVAHGVGER